LILTLSDLRVESCNALVRDPLKNKAAKIMPGCILKTCNIEKLKIINLVQISVNHD
jgi:hypothetical protein